MGFTVSQREQGKIRVKVDGEKIEYSVVTPEQAKKERPLFIHRENPVVIAREMLEELIGNLHSKDLRVEHIGFLGAIVKNGNLYITHQMYSKAGTRFKVDAEDTDMSKFRDEVLVDLPNHIILWFHTHPGHGPYPITTDLDMKTQGNFRSFLPDFRLEDLASLVFDTDNKQFSAFDVKDDKFVFVPIEILPKEEIEKILKEKT